MGILKFSIIGFFVMMPFFFVAYMDTERNRVEAQFSESIQSSVEEASMDAAFVMKTYSKAYYDSEDAYHIEIPYEEVVQVFFDSMKFRGFEYESHDFPVLAFLGYDGVVLYNPSLDLFYPKVYYVKDEFDKWTYVTLGKKCMIIDKNTLAPIYEDVDPFLQKQIILKTLEESLNRCAISLDLDTEYYFSLPEADNGFYKTPINDISFIGFYSSDRFYGLGRVEVFSIKPSGIMKMKDLLPIDI